MEFRSTDLHSKKLKLCYMDTKNFIICIKTKCFYENIANDIKKWFETANYDEDDKNPLQISKKSNWSFER